MKLDFNFKRMIHRNFWDVHNKKNQQFLRALQFLEAGTRKVYGSLLMSVRMHEWAASGSEQVAI